MGFSVWLKKIFTIVRLLMRSFFRRRCGVYFLYIQKSHIPPSEHNLKVTCSHPALNLRGLGGNLIDFHCFIMRLIFIICRLVGFTSDTVSRGVVHRSLYSANNNKTLLCECIECPKCIETCRYTCIWHIDDWVFSLVTFLWFTGSYCIVLSAATYCRNLFFETVKDHTSYPRSTVLR